MLEYIRQDHSRLTLSLDLMLTTAHMTVWPITNGFISYRSHAEAFIMRTSNPIAMRTLFEEKYTAQADALTKRLRQLLEALDHEQDAFPFTLAWAALMKHYWNYGVPLIESKAIDLMPSIASMSGDNEVAGRAVSQHIPSSFL